MTSQPDILIRSRDETPVAIIEVKNRREWPESLAADMRRNMIVHDVLPSVPYFLLLSQQKGFIWQQGDDATDYPDRPPDAEFPMEQVVARYRPVELSQRWMRGSELEFVVLRWLDDLAAGARHEDDETEHTLARIGFLDAIADASILPAAVL